MGDFIGGLLIMLLIIAICSTIPAIFLRLSAKWISKTEVVYGHAYKTILTAALINTVLMFGFGFLGPAAILFFPVGFCVMAAIIGSRCAMPFAQACLVTLITGAISGVILGVLFGILMVAGVAAMIGAGAGM